MSPAERYAQMSIILHYLKPKKEVHRYIPPKLCSVGTCTHCDEIRAEESHQVVAVVYPRVK